MVQQEERGSVLEPCSDPTAGEKKKKQQQQQKSNSGAVLTDVHSLKSILMCILILLPKNLLS